jgi:hypothetical protein
MNKQKLRERETERDRERERGREKTKRSEQIFKKKCLILFKFYSLEMFFKSL